MKNNKERGLQKFTNSQLATRLPKPVEDLLKQIIQRPSLTIDQIFELSEEEKGKIKTVLTAGYLTLAGDDRDIFLEKTDEIISKGSRNEIWERNHWCILNVISWQTIHQRQIPSVKSIAEETGLSRVTVAKHLKEYYDSETYKEKESAYKFLREKLLTRIYSYAYDGNMKAAKIFMDATTDSKSHLTINNQENNFIQINGLTITQAAIKNLSPEKLQKLQDIIE
jgi:hypothetical protein